MHYTCLTIPVDLPGLCLLTKKFIVVCFTDFVPTTATDLTRVDSTRPYFLKNLTISFGFTSTETFPTKTVRASFSFFVPSYLHFAFTGTSLPVLALLLLRQLSLKGFMSTFTILGAYFFALSSVSDDDKSPGTYSSDILVMMSRGY